MFLFARIFIILCLCQYKAKATSAHVVYADSATLLLEPAPSSNVILTLALTVAGVGEESVILTVTVWTPDAIALTPAAVALKVMRPVAEEIDRPAVVTAGRNS